jgi:hypothetical protein
MNNKILIALVLGIILILTIAIGSVMTSYTVLEEPETMADINLKANVFVSKNGVLIYEGHNVFTDAGKEHVEAFLGTLSATGSPANYIAVGNGTAPIASSTTLNLEIATAGLTRAQGTYSSTGTGAWKIEKVFSVTGTVNSINSTALFNASSTGTMLAGDTFTNTNVANGVVLSF